jgi:hypothetical protein
VTLSLLGPAGTDTLTRLAYIVATNASPLITSGVTASNALLEAGGVTVVVGGQTNVFSIGATDPGNNPLNFQWSFGDGTTNAWASTNIAEHVYTNCGPFDVEVTVSNNFLAVSSNFTVVVACEMQVTKLQAKLNFKKSDADKFNLTAIVELPDGFDPSGKSVSVNVAGAQATFALDANGKGANAQGTCKLSFNSKTNDWTLKVSQKKGDWQTPWAATGLIDDDVPKPGDAVTLPVVVLVGDEGFAADEPMVYVAKEGKSGTAKQQ